MLVETWPCSSIFLLYLHVFYCVLTVDPRLAAEFADIDAADGFAAAIILHHLLHDFVRILLCHYD